MTNQPDALRVADALEVDKWHVAGVTLQTAADLLREQHAEIERLRAEVLAEREACVLELERNADKTLEEIVGIIHSRGEVKL